MAYLQPSEFVTKLVDAGEAKIHMGTRDTLIRAFMAGATLARVMVISGVWKRVEEVAYPVG
jgi:formate/nitrite transporter FocA (FNT family)